MTESPRRIGCDAGEEARDDQTDGGGRRRRARPRGQPLGRVSPARLVRLDDDEVRASALLAASQTERSNSGGATVAPIECVGCLLPAPAVAELDAFVEAHAMRMCERELWLRTAHLYEQCVRHNDGCGGCGAARWSAAGVSEHYSSHAYHPHLEAVRLCRQLRGLRELAAAQFQRVGDAKARRIFERLATTERRSIARIPKLRTPRRIDACVNKPVDGHVERGSSNAAYEDGDIKAPDDDKPTRLAHLPPPTTMEPGAARDGLRAFLASHLVPCTPRRVVSAQPTLVEVLRGDGAGSILAASHRRRLNEFNGAKPPGRRRCHCRHRAGGACHFVLNGAFVKALAETSPCVARSFATKEELIRAVGELLQLELAPAALAQGRHGYRKGAVFGWRWRDDGGGRGERGTGRACALECVVLADV